MTQVIASGVKMRYTLAGVAAAATTSPFPSFRRSLAMVEFQLTPIEMILFALAVVASLYFGYKGFKKVYLIIKRGQGDFPAREIPRRLWNAAGGWRWA
jgi:hypothetical protein